MVTLAEALASSVPNVSRPVVDETDRVAIRYHQPAQVVTECGPRQYIFVPKANLSIAWVPQSDAQCVLDKRGGCCGQRRPGVFTYANASHVRQWTNGGGK